MDDKLIKLVYELKDLLSKDDRVISLNSSESLMNDNEEVMKLAYTKDMAIDEVNLIPESMKESETYKKAIEKLSIAKSNLQTHPVVVDYLKRYSIVRDLYFNINEILFSGFQEKLCEKK